MRIRPLGLLLALIALGLPATSATAAAPTLSLTGVGRLSARPSVPLPAASSVPATPSAPATPSTPATPALPRTGTDVRPLLALGALMIVLGLGGQLAVRRRQT